MDERLSRKLESARAAGIGVGLSWEEAENLLQLQVENEKLKESVKFLTKYDDDIDGLQAENKWLKEALRIAECKLSYLRKRYPEIDEMEQALKDKWMKGE